MKVMPPSARLVDDSTTIKNREKTEIGINYALNVNKIFKKSLYELSLISYITYIYYMKINCVGKITIFYIVTVGTDSNFHENLLQFIVIFMKILVRPTITIKNSNFSYNFSSCIYRDKCKIAEYFEQSKLQNASYQTSIAMAKCLIKMFIPATLHTTDKFIAVHNSK